MNIIYPYYKLFKADKSKLIGLTNAKVIIQKKYDDDKTFTIFSDNGKIIVGDKKEFDLSSDSIFRLKLSKEKKDFFNAHDNLIFYGSLLDKSFVLWDAYDIYNNQFVNTKIKITKYKAKEYYYGPFNIKLLEKYPDHVYRFINPLLTFYV